MEPSAKRLVVLLILSMCQVLLIATSVFVIRRRNRAEPSWSWPKSLGMSFLLSLAASGVGLIPVVGIFAALIVTLIGLKRFTRLDVLSTFVLSFCLGLLVFATAAVLSNQFQIDLLE